LCESIDLGGSLLRFLVDCKAQSLRPRDASEVGTDRYLEVGVDQHEEGIVIGDSKGRGLNWFALIFLKHVWKELNGLIGSVKLCSFFIQLEGSYH